MQLVALSEHVRLVASPINVGVIVLNDHEVALVDTALTAQYARKILGLVQDWGYRVTAILNTHAHADHVGGNRQIHATTGCRVFAPPMEAAGIEYDMMLPIGLYGGVPPDTLLNRFTLAEPCPVTDRLEGEIALGDRRIRVIDLPGHSVDQKGLIVDDVAFIADSVFATSHIAKHRLLYCFDPERHLRTLAFLRDEVRAATYVGGHLPVVHDLALLVTENRQHHEGMFALILSLLTGPVPFDRLLKNLLHHLGIRPQGWEHFLYRSTLKGYLTGLWRRKQADFKILDNLLVWYRLGPSDDKLPQKKP